MRHCCTSHRATVVRHCCTAWATAAAYYVWGNAGEAETETLSWWASRMSIGMLASGKYVKDTSGIAVIIRVWTAGHPL